MSSFKRVFNVSLTDYNGDILVVHEKIVSPIKCASECENHCLAIAYDPQTRECITYGREISTGDSPLSARKVYSKRAHLYPSDCSEVNPISNSGVNNINLANGLLYNIFCDMDNEGGPWTVIQNRQDEQVSFARNWTDYKTGFGDLDRNFWLGLDIIHLLTRKPSILRIELVSRDGDAGYAQYSAFSVADESDGYRLSISGFTGDVSNAMEYHNGRPFVTNDKGDQHECAKSFTGGWWFFNCLQCNLNGRHVDDIHFRGGVSAMKWNGFYYYQDYAPMLKSRMLLKPSR
ncbi:microfibril-associated glycoprotein 4-like [Ylistrum balloti]|uniref:microfibril-associated glycoprotein 4-like n=1 Tax=Ylistrum balloti TaxID=509963 RepID=UPI0029059231|nr:microfibril-associated glycoprotein 4-like [Ylistrum balloti]